MKTNLHNVLSSYEHGHTRKEKCKCLARILRSVVVMYEFGVNASQMTCSILGGYLLQVDGVGVVAAA